MQKDGDESDFNESRAEVFEAISHPARIKILQALNDKPMGFAELGREVGIEGGGHLGFHLRKLSNLVKMTPEGVYALTGDGKEALWTVNALRKSSNGSSKASVASVKHRNWAKPVLGGLLIALITFGAVAAYQQEQLSLLNGQIASQNSQISSLQSQIVSHHGDSPSFYSGMNASLVIGKPNFKTALYPLTSHSLDNPVDVAVDTSGNLWIADGNRILEFNPPFTNWASASLVLGQPDFTGLPGLNFSTAPAPNMLKGPSSIAFDPAGNLWVVDSYNERVLEFKSPFSNGMDASLVIGQPNFVTGPCITYSRGPCPATGNNFAGPSAVAFDSSGDLWVADDGYGRILEFAPPFTNDMNASLVIGQTGFASPGGCSPGGYPGGVGDSYQGPCDRNTLAGPNAITFDSVGNLWVSDARSDRVLEFTSPFSNGMNASLVIGQPIMGFIGRLPAGPSPFQNVLSLSWGGLHFDSTGNLWVSDGENNRVLEFRPPFSNSMDASLVIGQSNFTAALFTTTQMGLANPSGVTFDHAGNLWVVDTSNNRALQFKAPFSNGMNASLVIGEFDFTTNKQPTTQSQLTRPNAIALDNAGNLWVTDGASNRVLGFKPPFSNGMYASLVIGEPDFASTGSATFCPLSVAQNFNCPMSLAFDSSGDLWVAGLTGVLEFKPPFSNDMGPSLVMGQSVMSRGAVEGMAFDHSGNLWITLGVFGISESGVFEFKAPFSAGMNASSIISTSCATAPSKNCLGIAGPLAFDSSGDLWVAEDYSNGTRFLVSRAPFTAEMKPFQTIYPDSASFNYTSHFESMSFDSSGNLFVGDGGDDRILEFKAPLTNGTHSVVAIGQGRPPLFSEHVVTQAGFDAPTGIAFDTKGSLWVVDNWNGRVLRFDPAGPVSALPINGGSSGLTSSDAPQASTPNGYLEVAVVVVISSLVAFGFLKRKMWSVPAS